MPSKIPYQFAFHDRVPKEAPVIGTWTLVTTRKKLTREEKDLIFDSVDSSGLYKYMGWAYPFYHYMKTYLVKYKHNDNTWIEIKAFDKTCIRNSHRTKSGILEIIELPIKELPVQELPVQELPVQELINRLKENQIEYKALVEEKEKNGIENLGLEETEDYGFYQGKLDLLANLIPELEALNNGTN